MSQDWTIQDFKVGDFKDQNGNAWCTVVFSEMPGTPLTWVVKDPTKVTLGTQVYGRITDETGKNSGKPYKRFRREQKPDQQHTYNRTGDQTAKSSWTPRDDESIRIQWALGRTYEKHGATEQAVKDARWLIAVHDKLKQSASQVELPTATHDDPPQPQSGYEKAKAQAQAIKQRQEPEVEPLPEYQPGEYDPYNDDTFDPSQIPY